jgi:membrane protein YqaA with SNARE-associated domain
LDPLERQRTAFDLERPGSRLRVRVSLHAEIAPAAGFVDPPFRWEDVLDGGPPSAEERGPPIWCVPAGEMLSVGDRVENVVLVCADPHTRAVELEDALYVTARALAPAIETEREVVGVKLEEARRAAEMRAADADHPIAERVHRMHAKLVGGARSFTRGLVSAPDRLANRIRRAAALLSTPEGRTRVRRGMVDPNDLTPEEKAVTLTVGIAAVFAALVVAHFAVTLAVPDLARPWRTMFFLFLYGFVTSLGLPLPIEPALLPAAMSIGPIVSIVTTVVAKVLAAWMVFFVGDEVNDRLRARAEESPRFARFMDASERFAQRFGLVAVAAFIATPGLPDAVALYVFGSLHMRLWRFLVGVAIGGLVLYTALTYGLLALLF